MGYRYRSLQPGSQRVDRQDKRGYGAPCSGNADVDFVKRMIAHHHAAIDMANTVLAFGKDGEVKKVAEGVVKADEADIATMEEWLRKQGQ